jgi:XTP/dITP diphosphohydrolase
MKEILIATGNSGKFLEMMEVLSVLPIRFFSLADKGFTNNVEEIGRTYEENAFLKAEHFHRKTGLPVIAEDSGITVDALSEELGVRTRRWGAGENATDEEWLAYFLGRMQKEENRDATFFCAMAFVSNDIQKSFFGEIRGRLLSKPSCNPPKGIPLSALFVPQGKTQVFAQMEKQEKNAISHRGNAAKKLKNFLEDTLSLFQG